MPERMGDLTCTCMTVVMANSAVFPSSNNTVLVNLKNTPVLKHQKSYLTVKQNKAKTDYHDLKMPKYSFVFR